MTRSKFAALVLILAALFFAVPSQAQQKKILVFTRQAKTFDGKAGFIHNNTQAAADMLKKLAGENSLGIDVTEDPAVFTDANLKQYSALVFSNTNNQVLDTEDEKAALQHFIKNGGGFVGIHCATGSMRNWDWFCAMIGGRFQRHPKLQPFTIKVVDRTHPSTSFLGETWKWEDEFYLHTNMAADLHMLLAGDLTTVTDAQKPQTPDNTFPLAWCHEFEGARVWYTALGHKPEHYSDPMFQKHILNGILWVMRQTPEKK
jgi:uncharacterized protein